MRYLTPCRKKELCQDREIWAGLNHPEVPLESADIAIFGVPYDGSVSFRAGAREAPDAIRNITRTISPTTEDFKSFQHLKIKDLGNVKGRSRDEVFTRTTRLTRSCVKNNRFFIMLGGDHSVTIPVCKGIDTVVENPFGIVHIDAHFDLCDSLNQDRFSHGCTARRAMELDHVKGIEDIFFLGVRSIETDELDFFNHHPVQVRSARDISRIGPVECAEQVKKQLAHLDTVYLTLDIDCLDPAYAAGTGTPQFGGLNSRELLTLIEQLFDLPIIGMDIVEVAPGLDPSLTSVFAARKIITEVFGFISEKQR